MTKHTKEVREWFETLRHQPFTSDVAEKYRKRLLKYEDKLFMFLEHDGIPWNNNNAEHAVKRFAKYRRLVTGRISERGLSDYLILLSLHETCNYRGVGFLDFLLSKQRDVDRFCETAR